jgi:hypothetical protein
MRKPLKPDCYDYVRRVYHVPAYVGVRVKVGARDGVLVPTRIGHYLSIHFDGAARESGPYHPTDGIVYLAEKETSHAAIK